MGIANVISGKQNRLTSGNDGAGLKTNKKLMKFFMASFLSSHKNTCQMLINYF